MSAVDHHDPSRPTNLLGTGTRPTTAFSEDISSGATYNVPSSVESLFINTIGIQQKSEIDSTTEAYETTYYEADNNREGSSSTAHELLILNDETKTTSISRSVLNIFDNNFCENTCNCINLTDEKGDIVPDYDNANSCTEWRIEYDEGYNVDITLQMLDLDRTSKDFLLISSGPNLSNDDGNPIFTGRLNDTKQYRIPGTGKAYILFVTYKSEAPKPEGFSIRYRRQGELTTPPPTTTPSSVPVPPDNNNDTIVVAVLCENCKLEHHEDVDKVIILPSDEAKFKSELADETSEFCKRENITLQDSVTKENIYIISKWPCVQTWPKGEKCIHMQLAIAVNHTRSHYELTKVHLQKLWDEWNESTILKKLGPPLYKTHTIVWTLSIVIFFIILILIFYLWANYLNCSFKKEKEESSETSSTMEVPPFFSHMDEQMDDPEFVPYFARYSVATESSTDDTGTYDKRPFSGDSLSRNSWGMKTMGIDNKVFFEEEEEDEYEVMNRRKMLNQLNNLNQVNK